VSPPLLTDQRQLGSDHTGPRTTHRLGQFEQRIGPRGQAAAELPDPDAGSGFRSTPQEMAAASGTPCSASIRTAVGIGAVTAEACRYTPGGATTPRGAGRR
jgi:hypothetical protein